MFWGICAAAYPEEPLWTSHTLLIIMYDTWEMLTSLTVHCALSAARTSERFNKICFLAYGIQAHHEKPLSACSSSIALTPL